MQALIDDGKQRMNGAIAALNKEFDKLRTGRASTALVDNIVVDYYGTPTPVSQLASVSVPDPKTLTIQPWDKGAFAAVEKAILASDLGLTPNNDGSVIRITIPALTEERRKELVKVAKKYTEDCKIAIRNVRRDLNDQLKSMEKEKEISEDERKKGEGDVQKLTDDFVKQADTAAAAKEKEILAI
ncbi:ribosome recycling factor [Pseudodesulfovibrio sp. zrk46]|uniref:ribosome recycling factor n=1 Tax=Pseudodesulfovibrio sp. zrk46 TaxID=2725288 RepID=UPI00144994F4|nr:ribosome recycling factor [Pseudodesulfovibrio sp. zrk46]QJB58108.1 ribosome recycling factor [Pseudodesulfovibrio sp. zrk46]